MPSARPCLKHHPDPRQSLRPDGTWNCNACKAVVTEPMFRARWNDTGVYEEPPSEFSCIHFGPQTGNRYRLLSCNADPPRTIPANACAVFGECTREAATRNDTTRIPVCKTCSARVPKMTWAYGVTTVPSRADLLRRTLASLHAGGFDAPRLFVDDPRDRLGPWGRWWLGLHELVVRNPTADRFAMFQDDVVCVRNLRAYLDRQRYPARGYWNLFTFLSAEWDAASKRGWFESPPAGGRDGDPNVQRGAGALALVFSRDAAWSLLGAPDAIRKAASTHLPDRNIDGAVVNALNAAGYREYVHAPSLVQHTGTDSVARPGKVWEARSETFPGEGVDALTFLRSATAEGVPA